MKEREIIALLAEITAGHNPELLVGIGDDCAVLRKDQKRSWLVTMDTLVEGVHFDRTWHPPALLGRKTVAVNISDIAAMGGDPLFAFLSLGLPAGFDPGWLEEFSRGLGAGCHEFGCLLAGGDTVRSPAGVVITLTLIGEVEAERVVLRRGAKEGDRLWVSGTLGGAAAGLELCRRGVQGDSQLRGLVSAHLDPRPRLELGQRLAHSGLVHAMMDLSDGLATDLAHLCLQSGVGVRIDPAALPCHASLPSAARRLGRDPLAWMLTGGEDYELAFAASGEQEPALRAIAEGCGVAITAVGTFDRLPGVRLAMTQLGGTGEMDQDISYRGYDHF